MDRLYVHILNQYLVGIHCGIAAEIFKIEATLVMKGKFTDLPFKQVVINIYICYCRAEVFNIDIIKVHLLHQRID